MDPAGFIRLERPGVHLTACHRTLSFVALDAAEFEEYLHKEGLDRIIEQLLEEKSIKICNNIC